jgi:pyrroloquinoline-quinone synthase
VPERIARTCPENGLESAGIWLFIHGMDELQTWVCEQAAQRAIPRHDYFRNLVSGGMSREQFAATQRQFFFAVQYFPRPMAALMARMPRSSLRQGLVHNIMEEHGGDEEVLSPMDPALAHDRTFVHFLETLGAAGEMGALREGPAVRAFNTSLIGTCLMEPVETAFGCLGVIEHAFADLSAIIGRIVVVRGWIAEADLVHYKLHAEIDQRHAADFFKVAADAWAAGGERRKAVEDGVHLGLHVFDRLYADLWQETVSPP